MCCFVFDQNVVLGFIYRIKSFFCHPMERISFIESTYVRCICYKRLRRTMPSSQSGRGEIKSDLWAKLKLALCADFLILCISSRYCLCVSKCTLLHKLCSFVFFFQQPRLCSRSRTLRGSEAAQSDFLTLFLCVLNVQTVKKKSCTYSSWFSIRKHTASIENLWIGCVFT